MISLGNPLINIIKISTLLFREKQNLKYINKNHFCRVVKIIQIAEEIWFIWNRVSSINLKFVKFNLLEVYVQIQYQNCNKY